MTSAVELWINKTKLTDTKTVQLGMADLQDGEVRVKIDKFAFTSNNVSYALSGDMIGYWKFFPTDEDPWGKVTVWGMADVIESKSGEIAVGERIYGFFPMSSHVTLQPGKIKPGSFVDFADHRKPLPGLYNIYMRCAAEPPEWATMENERCLYFPLFITGFVIADFLSDNDWFDAQQVIVGSASSKTGIGTAAFIKSAGFKGQVIGLTSPRNAEFVSNMGYCDQTVMYENAGSVAGVPTVYVDMTGNAAVRSALHNRLGDNMKSNQMVGLTHWDQNEHDKGGLPGAKPVFFFAPAQIDKRNADWGPGVLMERGYGASAQLAISLKGQIAIEHHTGTDALNQVWQDMLANKIDGTRGIMVSV